VEIQPEERLAPSELNLASCLVTGCGEARGRDTGLQRKRRDLNPTKCHHSASLCRLPLSLKPKEMALPIKTTQREAIFVTEDRVNLKANGLKSGILWLKQVSYRWNKPIYSPYLLNLSSYTSF